jgi:uncharacterized protein
VGGEPGQPASREVVATMMEAGEETPAHWGADFWIGDIDAAAVSAPQLGGKLVQEPYDVPGTPLRQAVLADPAGTVFSATQLNVPEGAG